MLKLKILDKEHDLLNIKSIKSDLSMITIEDKGKGLILLISKDIKEDIDNFKGFKIIRENDQRFIELLGLDIKLKLEIITKLNISKKLIFIEEIKDKNYRLTFSDSIIKNIKEIDIINIIYSFYIL